MESKQMTLRSQTVQCPHCGEYYSVTYKYCPFCDAGRKAEARKKAARKQQAASLFTGLFSSREDDAGMDVPVRESGHHRERQGGGQRQSDGGQRQSDGGQRQSDGGQRQSSRGGQHRDESRSHQRPVRYDYDTPIPRSEGFRKKKTSEMTEEEKKAYRAEREARAAARKRERDRAARAAALTDLTEPASAAPAETAAPVIPAEPEAAQPAAATPILSPSGMETVEITIDPMSTAPADLSALAASLNAQDAAQPDGGDGVQAAPAETMPVVEVPTPTPEITPPAYDPSRILQGDSELDALLSEIRGMLDEGPSVPPAGTEAPVLDPQPVLEEMPPVEAVEPSEAPVSVGAAETVPAGEAVPPTESPAAPEAETQPAPEAAAAETQPAPEAQPAAPEAQAAPEAVPAYEDPELLWSAEATTAAAATLEQTEPAPAPERQPRSAERQPRPRKKQKSGLPLVPIIAAVAVVIVAALLVSKVIVPNLQKSKEAETISLVQTQVVLNSPNATETLTPVFTPKGSTGEIKWTCSNWGVVDVDPNGLLTAKAPGTALVAATLPNGESATVDILCTWGEEGLEAQGTESEGEAAVETAGLSATDMTLDAEGKTQQLTLNGVAGLVKWTSSKPSVAAVSADGTVTAVNKGSATITAEANGSKYNCNVRCVW